MLGPTVKMKRLAIWKKERKNTWSLGMLSEGVGVVVVADIISVLGQFVSCVRLCLTVTGVLNSLEPSRICSSRYRNTLSPVAISIKVG